MTESMIIPPFISTPNIERNAFAVIVTVGGVGLTFGKSGYDRMLL